MNKQELATRTMFGKPLDFEGILDALMGILAVNIAEIPESNAKSKALEAMRRSLRYRIPSLVEETYEFLAANFEGEMDQLEELVLNPMYSKVMVVSQGETPFVKVIADVSGELGELLFTPMIEELREETDQVIEAMETRVADAGIRLQEMADRNIGEMAVLSARILESMNNTDLN